jgi:hypothetical protein
MSGWFAKPLADVPRIDPEEAGDPVWHPLQHYFGLSAFGANAYVAAESGGELLGAHDEIASGQEELYIVVTGVARFTLDGDEVDAPAPFVVAVPDPAVPRAAVAVEAGTTVLAFGGERREGFQSSWRESHFRGVPRAGDGIGGRNPAD